MATLEHDAWVQNAFGTNPADYRSTPDTTGSEPNQSVDPNASQPNQCVDPNAGQPNQSVDPNASQPNQSVDPNASQPNQSVDPNASQPNQSVDPNASPPNQSVDPAGQPNRCVDPNAGQLNQSVDPNAAPPDEAASKVAALDQAYDDALNSGSWQAAAEALNGFNAKDITDRLASRSSDEIAKLHQGALDNPRLGPHSMVAMMTDTGAPLPAAPEDTSGGDSRSLTSGETSYAQTVFQDTLDYSQITITRGKLASTGAARTVGNTINFETTDFVAGTFDLTSGGQSTLIHEMTHVWQYQHQGWTYAPEALWAQAKAAATTGSRNAAYDWESLDNAGVPWQEWNPEAQAQAVQDYNGALRVVLAREGTAAKFQTLNILQKYIDKMLAGPSKSTARSGDDVEPNDGGLSPGGTGGGG
jgi:hypothetical protein